MTMTLLDEPPDTAHEIEEAGGGRSGAAERLRAETAAVRLHVRWPGLQRTLSQPQKKTAAAPFAADEKALSAAKRTFDVTHPAFRAVTAVRTRAVAYWKAETLPFTEPGVRLLPRGEVVGFEVRLTTFRQELDEAATALDARRGELLAVARRRLGELFDPNDYPERLSPLFGLSWDWPSVEPPDYLARLAPRLYEAECRRVSTRFEEAVSLAEEAFARELASLVEHLAERLRGEEDGKPKVFRDSAVENLRGFFDRFRRLSLRSDAELESLVSLAEGVLGGREARELRDRPAARERVAAGLASVREALEPLLVERPRRGLLRAG
jgi:hypothetical protein